MADTTTWQDRMIQANDDLDALEAGGAPKTLTVEGAPALEETAGIVSGGSDATAVSEEPKALQPEGVPIDLSALASAANEPVEVADSASAGSSGDDEKVRRISELEAELQRVKSENGRARTLSEQLRAKETELQELRGRSETKGAAQFERGALDVFSDEESELMSPEMRKFLGSRFAAIEAENSRLKEEVSNASKFVRESASKTLQSQIGAQFPNLHKYVGSEAWRTYCREVDPITKQPNGKLFTDSVERFDAQAASAIISRFLSASGVGSDPVMVGRKPEERTIQPVGGAPKVAESFKFDEVNSFLEGVYSGKVSLSNPKHTERFKLYKDAMSSGRVVE